ncbi:hypothetical protein GCM10011414_26460 [Croceivirga lutea]|nr:hypothetical protein GCM10011414_26460 [Croceivirga lutea]
MVKMRNWLIVATFFCLWLSTQLPESIQNSLAYFLILTFGVLHGANDIQLINKVKKDKQKKNNYLYMYVAAIVGVSLLFLVSAQWAFYFFLIISAYHFGEQHFAQKIKVKSQFDWALFVSYGSLILFMLFYKKINKVEMIIVEFTGNNTLNIELIFWVSAGLFFGVITAYAILKKIQLNWFAEVLLLGVLYVVFEVASLSWAFAIYFIFWHSFPSIKDQLYLLYGDYNKKTWLSYLKSSWLYYSISIFGLLILYLVFKERTDYFITLILYLLAAISFPHIVLMSKLENLKANSES